MNKYGARIAACALMGSLSLSGYQMTLEAKVNSSSTEVPAAGVAVVLNESSSIQDLQDEVVQNIAYLENASGLQPNIVLASKNAKKAAWPGGLASAVKAEASVSKVSEDIVEELVNNAKETEKAEEESSRKETEEQSHTEESSLAEELTEALVERIERSSETETAQERNSETETEEKSGAAYTEKMTEEHTAEDQSEEESTSISEAYKTPDKEKEFNTSAGFSALETYDDVETEEQSVKEKAEKEEAEEETETEETATEEEEQDFSGLVIAKVSNYVNVRSMPSEEGEIVGKLYDKSVGEFVKEENGWYKITSGNCTGYVKGEYCVVGDEAEALAKEVGTTYAVVNTTTLKVRKEASTESSVLGLVPIEEELVVVEELDGWVKIAIEEGDGFVSREYVNLRTDFVHAESREEEEARLAKEAKAREQARAAAEAARAQRANTAANSNAQKSADNQATILAAQNTAASSEGSAMGKEVVNYATQFVGNPYVYGGTSLTNGADCSGFVMSVYSNFGVSLPHSSSAMRSQGYDVGGLANAQPGDIVCYSGHVGLYVGNGQIVHASTSRTGIIVSNAGYRSVLAVRRIF